jgi:hypothetical protein
MLTTILKQRVQNRVKAIHSPSQLSNVTLTSCKLWYRIMLWNTGFLPPSLSCHHCLPSSHLRHGGNSCKSYLYMWHCGVKMLNNFLQTSHRGDIVFWLENTCKSALQIENAVKFCRLLTVRIEYACNFCWKVALRIKKYVQTKPPGGIASWKCLQEALRI